MKRIRRLDRATPSLFDYLDCAGDGAEWDGFRSHLAGAAYLELAETLQDVQHGLCGYCEIGIIERDRQVEHVIPQSDRRRGAARVLDHANMIVCCKGGTLQTGDENRRLDPVGTNRSCGEAKGKLADADFIDPRMLPALPSVTRVNFDGRIEADTDACQTHGIAAARVEKTIKILGLNVERLRLAREKHWNALNDNWESHFNDSQVMEAAARVELLPDRENCLPRFFTTSRSYFEAYAEGVLVAAPQDWV